MKIGFRKLREREKSKMTCAVCGNEIVELGFDKKSPVFQYMKKNGVCYDCAYWRQIIENPPEYLEIINGTAYRFMPFVEEKTIGAWLGNKGKEKYMLRKDFTLAKSNDVWLIGKIPSAYIEKLPNTGWWISKKAFRLLSKGTCKCYAIGCFDRYHCFRYDWTEELKNGAFNKVPEDWKIGGERCAAFVNIDEIENFDINFKKQQK